MGGTYSLTLALKTAESSRGSGFDNGFNNGFEGGIDNGFGDGFDNGFGDGFNRDFDNEFNSFWLCNASQRIRILSSLHYCLIEAFEGEITR